MTHNSERFLLLLDCEFLSVIGKLYCCFGVHKKHQVVTPLGADKYEETLMSVASYIKHSVDKVREVTENQKKISSEKSSALKQKNNTPKQILPFITQYQLSTAQPHV